MKPALRLLAGSLTYALVLAGFGISPQPLQPTPVYGAEEFRIRVTGPIILTLSVESLETFAATGEVTGDLKLYASFLDEPALSSLRNLLQFKFPLDVATVGNLSYSPLGRDTLFNLGKVIESTPGVNGFHGLRAAVIGAAAKAGSEGWTLLDVMREFPTSSIDVNVAGLADLKRELAVYLSYNRAAVQAIRDQAAAEAATQMDAIPADLADLSQPGPYSFSRDTITISNPALRQTSEGLTVNYDFDVDVYLPQGVQRPSPMVIVSHGFGAVKEDFVFLNEHLASYGYVVMAPDHVGSDLSYRQGYLGGRLNTLLSPSEFISRPQEISFLIDELERLVETSPDWATRLNLDQIAAIGDSLGSSTVMALAGAELTYPRLIEACDRDTLMLNFALYLQCRARYLPPQNYNLTDPRIRAVIAAHNLGTALYGPEGISQIDRPMLMVSGDTDIVAPVVTEQVFPFIWMQQQPRYLALLQTGTHFSSKPPGEGAGDVPSILMGEHRDVGSTYYKALATAFLGAHLLNDDRYRPYLTAAYAKAASEGQPMVVDMITSLTAEQVESAYEGTPPVAVLPPPLEPQPVLREESILEAIQRTGELKIAMRRDAVPFGYVNSQEGWSGYCPSLAIALRDYLNQKLQQDVDIELVALPSTLADRFDLVRDGNVYLECGPNTIRADVDGVTFSSLIFATGSRLLTTTDQSATVKPAQGLAGLDIGVLANSTNESYLQAQYPEANPVRFEGPTGREDAISAVIQGDIDAFLGDDILTFSEAIYRGQPTTNLEFIPELPLTCEYYGLALPSNDPEWIATVNQFLETDSGDTVWEDRLGEFAPYAFDTLNHCLNR
jgi:predicted dienelactone hydrolase